MKISDGIKQKGKPFEIPDCSRDELPEFFKELGFKTGAEIGVLWGKNLEKYCEAGLAMYGIDPYQSYEDHVCTNYINEVYRQTVEKFSIYPNCRIIRKMSMDALADFPDRSLDFVYIDGNHKFGYVAMDLMKWAKKVRKGGIIAGHDYYCHKGDRENRFVGPVVDAFTETYDIADWYLLGKKNPSPGEKVDDTLSFMFFKHW